ncbi:sensor histidine kinase [Nocardioides marmoribigeumensis]|uniref:histidine kinase n=1 Tax=Nocardioides marmoribigeumensis TaxID=433649 RepID=A0ABU2BZ12_9ACTN|nr:HAMP domain-containing sensor histidine kinase [Nocardioides marmoribigeumensis]MDR7363643.1 signal transduction histidine kinase [Nocardioides marmoribigeumensis]
MLDGVQGGPVEAERASEVARLRQRLTREREARRAAERTGEAATTALYDALQDLRAAQADLVEQAGRERLVAELVRDFRQDLDPVKLRDRACTGLQAALGVDRCEVLAHPWVDHPALATRLAALTEPADGLWVDDLEDLEDDPELWEDMGGAALGCEPILVGADYQGWLLVVSSTPRTWAGRDRALLRGIVRDLGASLVQADAWEQQAQTMRRLRELDQAKTDFVATVSHELRTPLSSIRGYSELLREGMLGALSSEQDRAVEVIDRNADRLLRLVGDLLTLAEVDSGAGSHHEALEPVDLTAVVHDSHRSLLPILRARRLEVVLPERGLVPTVLGVASHLDRVVLNLLSNAVKFTEDLGRVVVELCLADAPDPTRPAHVVLSVRDSGIGISREQQHRLFERFFRSVEAQQAAIQGTGLGLAVCKAIVDAHGGTIHVDSEVGVGTTVTVSLPTAV